ncbi:MAG: hybrid sensor histidine kinase/response regulator [Microcoleus sp. PH2017_10_PVI_O_A]|uniref:hybrid sensor histidine kinase/response regulator n=1 Tax=unclassified Microcoleus TaxID=2642155 RepID=UPI001D83FE8A|nr:MULTISPECIES: hybrid sensor histidine kinase/response regulator [unclassified Microcoleus]TAE81007.1 MAG: hybrid sensor histidine kinase/response regulator [Oscillatoriales cyanobacterium]MCC3407303.1 hybrid sensor histidine kinase/response regulator [Microcoleus sp. PH2017_10_PVI_O_A]MCC3463546.1 hybrid sensor histidine kinase/response regulator [Microcoleus sp. PH2017_11_PCY_U_A]MCC3479834.1 hybrid sensor histidine kinase/response regulator [Microcoleus sp. PH2017_12_PCY_D_A]MCC3528528.1 
MNDDDLNELIDAFTAETQEFLQSMETHLLAMEGADLKERQAGVKEMFRAAHSIKGAGSMLGFQNVSAAAHTLEDCFVILRDRTDLSALEPVTVTVLLQGVDILKKISAEAIQHSDVTTPDQTENLEAIAQIYAQFEAKYGKPGPPPVPAASRSAAPETLKLIFEHELPPIFNRLETELSQASEADLAKSVTALNQVYYQLSGLAGMLQLPDFGKVAEPLRDLIDSPDLTLQRLQSEGWSIAQNLQTARGQLLEGRAIELPQISPPPAENPTEVSETSETPDSPPPPPLPPSPPPPHSPSNTPPIPNPQRPTIRVDLERLTELVNLVGELVINRTNLELQESELRGEVKRIRRSIVDLNQFGGQLREEYDRLSFADWKGGNRYSELGKLPQPEIEFPPIANDKSSIDHGHFDILEMDRYTEFHSTAAEVIETAEAISQSATKLDTLAMKFERSTDQLRRITEQLRSRVMQLRVVSFSRAVDHLPRALRDMCLTYNKDVNLLLLGRDTKIDESLLDALRDPLVHLVRNAFDHGIEMPEVRQATGKPASGQIEIEARHQGGQTIITIADDGKGIDPEILRHKVVKKGLATEEQAQEFSIAELYDFLFWPGFSTAEEVSDLSGRGVGLDVVRTNLRTVRGTVKVDSRLGKGTSFIIKLPLLLSITEALMVKTDRNKIAVPLDAVEEILHVKASEVHTAGNQPMLWWREEFIRLVRLQDLLEYSVLGPDGPSPDPLTQDHIPVLVLASTEGMLAVAVERLIGQQEIVVKPLPPPLSKPRGVLGSTILGDGKVVTILDVDDLVGQPIANSSIAQGYSKAPQMAPSPSQSPQILVVDDSYTIRQLLSLMLTRARYRVVQAKDGLDALEKLQNGLDCSLAIVDIEMPRMDGFELLRSMRSTQRFAKIPVAMLTSRSGEKHRQMAMELGANQYFTKPYSESQLLEAIPKLIKH